jgi:hypothetical protein
MFLTRKKPQKPFHSSIAVSSFSVAPLVLYCAGEMPVKKKTRP